MKTNKFHRTAMARKGMSRPCKSVLPILQKLPAGYSVLDFGCGRGADVRMLRYFLPALDIHGWDPNAPEGMYTEPQGHYDIVLCTYVLNVCRTAVTMYATLKQACDLLAPNGILYLSVRNDVARDTKTQSVISFSDMKAWLELRLDVDFMYQKRNGYDMYIIIRINEEE